MATAEETGVMAKQADGPAEAADSVSLAGQGSDAEGEAAILPLTEGAAVGTVIGVIGAKGGVGTTALALGLAARLAGQGYRIGVLDADIASPDAYFRLAADRRYAMDGDRIIPLQPAENLQLMSFGGFMASPDEPMLWETRLMVGTALEFWASAVWDRRDLLIVDLPTGAGDLSGQLLHRLPFQSIYLVSTPDQECLKRSEQVRNYVDWNGVHCGGLLVNRGLSRPEDGSPEIAATRMGLPLLDAVADFAGSELAAPLWEAAVKALIAEKAGQEAKA